MIDAKTIYQELLDRISQAMWAGEDAAVLALLALPSRMGTLDYMHEFATADELLKTIRSFCDGLRKLGARDFHRICNEAAFDPDDPDRITGNHTTHVLAGGTYVLEPFLNEMTIIRRNGAWLGCENRALVRGTQYSAIQTAHIRGTGPKTN